MYCSCVTTLPFFIGLNGSFVLIKTYQIALCLSNEGNQRVGLLNSLKIMNTSICKIPPDLPLPKGGIIPLFGKEGRGEIS
jgi:hypothetical protein